MVIGAGLLFTGISALLLALGTIPFARYAWFLLQGSSEGHLQSLVIGSALWFIGGQMFITGLLALAIGWNRRMLEDLLFRMKEERTPASRHAVLRRSVQRSAARSEANARIESGRMQNAA